MKRLIGLLIVTVHLGGCAQSAVLDRPLFPSNGEALIVRLEAVASQLENKDRHFYSLALHELRRDFLEQITGFAEAEEKEGLFSSAFAGVTPRQILIRGLSARAMKLERALNARAAERRATRENRERGMNDARPWEELFLTRAACREYGKLANQPPQRNAGSRPPSDDSPASETPSSLGPRG